MANESLHKASEIVNKILQMNCHIAIAAEEQSQVRGGINRNIVNVHDLFEQGIKLSNTLGKSGSDVSEMANELKKIMSHFKVVLLGNFLFF